MPPSHTNAPPPRTSPKRPRTPPNSRVSLPQYAHDETKTSSTYSIVDVTGHMLSHTAGAGRLPASYAGDIIGAWSDFKIGADHGDVESDGGAGGWRVEA
mmetsp:Transcript_21060/g.52073  ORF Transcript_21060/g.52073 Transcript_21060/m.52073 type:complete len:99 (+) Transcript_21060:2410-2706(+)